MSRQNKCLKNRESLKFHHAAAISEYSIWLDLRKIVSTSISHAGELNYRWHIFFLTGTGRKEKVRLHLFMSILQVMKLSYSLTENRLARKRKGNMNTV